MWIRKCTDMDFVNVSFCLSFLWSFSASPYEHLQLSFLYPPDPYTPSPLQGGSSDHIKLSACALVGKGHEVAKAQDGIAVLLYLMLKES